MASVKLLQSSSDFTVHEDGSRNLPNKFKNAQPITKKNLEVTEINNVLKVQTDKPHLVSLGGGRLSTAVTLLPLPEGKTTLGSHEASNPHEINIQGTGIENKHCIIENIGGVVTLYPVAPMVAVDGMTIVKPTRLIQGSMICLGRSNYFRFNHPQEAQYMKSILPNTLISGPSHYFSPDGHETIINQPTNCTVSVADPMQASPSFSTAAGKRDQPIHFYRDELESEDFVEKVSKFEFLSHSYQKPVTSDPNRWFVRDGLRNRSSSSSSSSSSSFSAVSSPTSPLHPSSKCSKEPINLSSQSPSSQISSISSAKEKPKNMSLPSSRVMNSSSAAVSAPFPRFLPTFSKLDANISPKVFVPMKVSSAMEKPSHFPSDSVSSSVANRQQNVNKTASTLQLTEQQRQKVMKERIQEQELEQQEQQRLEEILNMCAEYERQAMKEKKALSKNNTNQELVSESENGQQENHESYSSSPKLSPNHSLHMNRIKTNGSLPRDRFNGKHVPDEAVNLYKPVKSTSSEDELNYIFTFESQTLVPSNRNAGHRSPNNYSTYPQSPRTRIKTVVNREKIDEVYENRLAISDYQLNNNDDDDDDRKNTKSMSLKNIPKETRSSSLSNVHNVDGKGLRTNHEEETSNRQLFNKKVLNDSPDKNFVAADPKITELQAIEYLKKMKMSLAKHVGEIKRKIMNLDTYEEEIIHELETERALLEGEYQELLEKEREDQEKICILKQKELDLINRADLAREEENTAILNARLKLEEEEYKLKQLDCNLDIQPEGSPERDVLVRKIKHQQEIVDLEKKNFEDLEFHQLEHEAHREEEREQIVAELTVLEGSCRIRLEEMKEIEKQKNDAKLQIYKETEHIQEERKNFMSRIQEEKNKLHAVECKLKEAYLCAENENLSDSSTRSSSDEERKANELHSSSENFNKSLSKKSSDDLILRVTSTSPIIAKDEVGEKTTATLKRIEKNRQIILEKQGGLVIEKERKRVQELKKKAADEVRSQWEERKQREMNCNSFNSIESEASSVTSSDILPESLSSEEYQEKITDPDVCPSSPDDDKELYLKVKQKEAKAQLALEDSRPLLQSLENTNVKHREKQTRQQRPLTRYLPIRRDDLNLKQHIESAGHQIELCPHIQLTASSCRGYLYKLGSKFRTWNKRWFVFDRSRRMLLYFSDKNEMKPRGGICFQYIMEVYVDHLHAGKSPSPKLTFCVKTIDRTFELAAPNAEAMRIWVDVIFTGAEGYQEFQPD